MSYCEEQDLIDRFGEQELIQLTDRTQSGNIDDDVLNRAIADADAEIDSKLSTRYTLPLISVPAILTSYACDIARYRLYDDQIVDVVTERYKQALNWLKDIAEGKANLPADAIDPDIVAYSTPRIVASTAFFSDDLLSKMP